MNQTKRWTPLHLHTIGSLLDGYCKPKPLAKRCVELGYSSCAVTDHGNMSQIASFSAAMREQGIKPILGNEIYLCKQPSDVKSPENRELSHLCVLAKNANGYRDILRLTGASFHKDHFYYKPRLSLDELGDYTQRGDLIAFSGHPGSDIANCIFKSPRDAYKAATYDEVKSHHLHEDYVERLIRTAEKYLSIFGRGNFFLEGQAVNVETMPASLLILRVVRWLSEKLDIPVVATADTHYIRREDAIDQRILLCKNLRTTLQRVREQLDRDEDVALGGFFRTDAFHLPTIEEMSVHHTPEELEMAFQVGDMIEDYSILSNPRFPKFPIEGWTQEGYLREVCRRGFKELIEDNPSLSKPVESYRVRLDEELAIWEKAGLSSYFLIISDVIRHLKSLGRWTGWARGSVGGCLTAYVTGCTLVDPLEYDLLFERFYNEARNTPGNINPPDVDMDMPITAREQAIRYTQNTYGVDHVAKCSTFGTLAGRSAVEAVMDAHGIDFTQRKMITKFIPDKNRVDEEVLEAEGEDFSLLRYALDVNAEELSDYVQLNDDGTLSGDYAGYFEQAMRLEGVKGNRGTHAAAVIISEQPLQDVSPLVWDEDGEIWKVDMEYPDAEKTGLLKFDYLGLGCLDKCEGVANYLRTGRSNVS